MSRNLTITAVPFEPITTSIYMYVPQPYHHSCSYWTHNYINKHVCPATLPVQVFFLDPLTTSIYMYVPQPYHHSCSFWIHNYINKHVCPATLPVQVFFLDPLLHQYTGVSRNLTITAVPFEPITTSIYMYVPQPYHHSCSFWVHNYINKHVCVATLPVQAFLLNP